ncbi:MAG: hypothetical protein ACOY5U_09645 [Pseudomonadota bacterium]
MRNHRYRLGVPVFAGLFAVLAAAGGHAASVGPAGCDIRLDSTGCILGIEDTVTPRLPPPAPPRLSESPLIPPDLRSVRPGIGASPLWREWRAALEPSVRRPLASGLPGGVSGLATRARAARTWARSLPLEVSSRVAATLPPVEIAIPGLAVQNAVVSLMAGGQRVELRMRMLRVVVALPVRPPTWPAELVPPAPTLFPSARLRPAEFRAPPPAAVPTPAALSALAGALAALAALRRAAKRARPDGVK